MTSADMDVKKYLSRIGFSGPAEPTLDVLWSLHLRHQLSVPFENLTIHSGGKIQLDLPVMYDKIVNQRRGGFCFENNGLFYWLLCQLGFQVTLLSGQVKSPVTGYYSPPFSHMVIMVSLEGKRWLCDVGYGTGFPFPLSLETSDPQEQGHRAYRIRQVEGMHFLEVQRYVYKKPRGDWSEVYKFTLEPRHMEDYEEMCQYHQTSPHSLFFCKSLCIIIRPAGRLIYIGRRLISTTYSNEENGIVKTTRQLKDEEIPDVLAKEFGVVLNAPLIPKDDDITPPPVMY
ncbi:arylamine N-acetyltransferase 2-like [Cheilinus undulatus]|uniref:arylamine N-acetyltransferase 2-like n=1 Tax=Cheilinus undulatus TaxID=241271 RepID=UPI001BD69119|nr:arylamine N-acetyltransferase 2-like [Cheilinus undulatus]